MAKSLRVVENEPGKDSEKITINLGYVDLGHVDLLVIVDREMAAVRAKQVAAPLHVLRDPLHLFGLHRGKIKEEDDEAAVAGVECWGRLLC